MSAPPPATPWPTTPPPPTPPPSTTATATATATAPAPAAFAAAFPGSPLGATADGTPTALVTPAQLLAAIQHLRDRLGYSCFRDLTVVDDPERGDRFELSYLLYSLERRAWFRLKARTAAAAPSIVALFAGADWYEREAFDLFGVRFDGHPNLQRLLLPDDWQGHPLRRDHPIGGEPVDFTVTRDASAT